MPTEFQDPNIGIPMAQGSATAIAEFADGEWVSADGHEDDVLNEKSGFTYPNLHRRVYQYDQNKDSSTEDYLSDEQKVQGELEPRKYELSVAGKESFRFVDITTHDEESRTSEIP